MPLRAYFEPRRAPLARLTIPGGLSGNGITVTGPVLEGHMSMDEALVLSWIRSPGAAQTITTQAGIASTQSRPLQSPANKPVI